MKGSCAIATASKHCPVNVYDLQEPASVGPIVKHLWQPVLSGVFNSPSVPSISASFAESYEAGLDTSLQISCQPVWKAAKVEGAFKMIHLWMTGE